MGFLNKQLIYFIEISLQLTTLNPSRKIIKIRRQTELINNHRSQEKMLQDGITMFFLLQDKQACIRKMSTERHTDLEQQYYGKKEDIRRLEEEVRKLEAKIYIPKEANGTSEPSKDRKSSRELRKLCFAYCGQ